MSFVLRSRAMRMPSASCSGPSVRPTSLCSARAVPPVASARSAGGGARSAVMRTTSARARATVSSETSSASSPKRFVIRSEPTSSERHQPTVSASSPTTICAEPPPTSQTSVSPSTGSRPEVAPRNASAPSSSAASTRAIVQAPRERAARSASPFSAWRPGDVTSTASCAERSARARAAKRATVSSASARSAFEMRPSRSTSAPSESCSLSSSSGEATPAWSSATSNRTVFAPTSMTATLVTGSLSRSERSSRPGRRNLTTARPSAEPVPVRARSSGRASHAGPMRCGGSVPLTPMPAYCRATRARNPMCPFLDDPGSAHGERAAHGEPAVRARACGDGATRGEDHVLDDREAEARAAQRPRVIGAVEALEQPVDVLPRDADAVVRGHQLRRPFEAAHADRARRAYAGVTDRVRHQVLPDHPEHARPHRQRERLVALHDEGHGGPVGLLRQLGRYAVERRQRVRVPERDDLAAGLELAQEEEVVDELAHLLDLAAGALEQARNVRLRPRARLEQDEQARERRAKLVRDRRGEAAPQLLVRRKRARIEEEERLAAVDGDPLERRRELVGETPPGLEPGEHLTGAGARRDDDARAVENGHRELAAVEEGTHAGGIADVARRTRERLRRGRRPGHERHRPSLRLRHRVRAFA